jgi:hypothetical protein
MSERKQKRGSEVSDLDEDAGILLEPANIELGSGYTLAVSYDENQRPIVDIKTYGQINLAQLLREIEGVFPNAQIRQKEQSNTVIVAKKSKTKLNGAKKQSR